MKCDRGLTALVLEGLPRTGCPVAAAATAASAAAAASCGREVFCREATRQVATVLDDLTHGRGRDEDLALLAELAALTAELAPCAGAVGVSADLLRSLRDEADEWEKHLLRRRCAAGVCPTGAPVPQPVAAGTGMRRRRRPGTGPAASGGEGLS